MTTQAKRKRSEGEQDEPLQRQPAWRQKAPARPRKRAKRKQFAASGMSGNGSSGRTETARVLNMPSRETWLAIVRVAALILTAAALTVGLIYLIEWPVLAVGRASTQIGGAQRIPPEEIYVQSGVDGHNILMLRSSEIAAQVKSMPGVARAYVHVRLPNQVIIDVREHAPLVAWQTVTTTVWLASDGAEVPQAGNAPPLQLIDQSAERLSNDAALKALVLQNLASVHAVQPDLTEFYYGSQQGLYYRAPEGWDVWLGDSGSMNDKLALAGAAAADIAKQGARPKVIDVRQSERRAMWW